MDAKIKDGDIMLRANGDYAAVSELDEAIQRVRTVALTDRGSFIYDRSLGVDYDAFSSDDEDPAAKLDMLFKEAAAGIGGVEIEVLSYDPASATVAIKVNYHGKSAVTEVDISGNI